MRVWTGTGSLTIFGRQLSWCAYFPTLLLRVAVLWSLDPASLAFQFFRVYWRFPFNPLKVKLGDLRTAREVAGGFGVCCSIAQAGASEPVLQSLSTQETC